MILRSTFLGTLRAVFGALGVTNAETPHEHASLTATTRAAEGFTATTRAAEGFTATTRAAEGFTATSE